MTSTYHEITEPTEWPSEKGSAPAIPCTHSAHQSLQTLIRNRKSISHPFSVDTASRHRRPICLPSTGCMISGHRGRPSAASNSQPLTTYTRRRSGSPQPFKSLSEIFRGARWRTIEAQCPPSCRRVTLLPRRHISMGRRSCRLMDSRRQICRPRTSVETWWAWCVVFNATPES